MIVCSCRRISDKDYPSVRELYKRLLQSDVVCCKCITDVSRDLKKDNADE